MALLERTKKLNDRLCSVKLAANVNKLKKKKTHDLITADIRNNNAKL